MELYEKKAQLFNDFNDNSLTENSVEVNDKLSRELKLHHTDIVNSYDKLHKKVAEMRSKPFSNEKVENLWHLVNVCVLLYFFIFYDWSRFDDCYATV